MRNQQFIQSFAFVLFSITLLSGYNYFSPLWREEIIQIEPGVELIYLSEKPVIAGSVSIIYDQVTLQDSLDYLLDHQQGSIRFLHYYPQVNIEYAVFPAELRNKYFNYEEIFLTKSDTTEVKRRIRKTEYKPLELLVKGNKTVTISVTDDEDFQLNQSLFLRISGKLSDDVNIQAQVSDSESPITPEGDSREISNLDQIYIRIFGKRYELGFGDLEHKFTNSEFMDFNSYFEGVKARWGQDSRITVAAALSRAQNASIQLSGIDGRQGPYWLSNDYGGEALIVPGSEKIYLNGSELQRGDDYTIDYTEGSLTFTEKYFVSSSDKIYATYQYSDETFRQQIFLQDSQWAINDNWSIGSAVYYRSDDADNPLTQEFSSSDLDSLEQAGDGAAFGSGIYETEKGLGEYILTAEGWYQYVGYDSTGTYNLSFYYSQGGDYILSDDGTFYVYAGAGLGDYLPGTKLEAPEAQGNYSFWSCWEYGNLELKGEVLLSSDDHNTLSERDDDDNLGWASSAGIKYEKKQGDIRPLIKLNWKNNSPELFTFDPLSSAVDYYETDILPDTLAKQQVSLEAGADFWQIIKPKIVLRQQEAGDEYIQKYLAAGCETKQSGLLPESKYRYLTWENEMPEQVSNFISQEAAAAYKIGKFKLGYEIGRQEKNTGEHTFSKDRDFGYLQTDFKSANSKLYWEQVITDSSQSLPRKISRTVGILTKYRQGRQQLEFDLAHREITDSLTTEYDLAKINYSGSLSRMISLAARYRLRNLDFYPKIRQLVYIGPGEGDYNEDGEEDEDGDYNWQIISIDYSNPEKSIELTSSAQINIKPLDPFPVFWQKMRLELEAAINEQSNTDNIRELYLLSASELMQDETTVYGTQAFKGRWWYDLVKNKLTFRLTREQENRLDNRYQSAEKVEINIEEAYLRWKYTPKVSFEFFLERRLENDTRYDSQIQSRDAAWETRYNPTSKFNYGVRLEYGREDGNNASQDYNYNLTKIEVQQTVNWFPQRTSHVFARIKFRNNDRNGDEYNNWLEEKRAGNVFIWNFSYDYKLNNYMKLSIEYKGDKYPEEDTSHEFKMEVAAEF